MCKFLAKLFGKKSKSVVEEVKVPENVCQEKEVIVPEVEEEVKTVEVEVAHTEEVTYYTLAEACKILGKSDKTIRKMLLDGKISGEKVDGKWRICL